MPTKTSILTCPQTADGVLVDSSTAVRVDVVTGGSIPPSYAQGTLNANPGFGQTVVAAAVSIAQIVLVNTNGGVSTSVGLFDNAVPNLTNPLFTVQLGPNAIVVIPLNLTLKHGGLSASNNNASVTFLCTFA